MVDRSSPETESAMQRLLAAAGWDAGSVRHKQLEDALDGANLEIVSREFAQRPARPVSFMEAMAVVESGFNTWKDKPHNKKWFNRIDGTPIPNDLMVNIAEAISHSSLSSTDREGK